MSCNPWRTLCVITVMVQRISYTIVDQPDGRFEFLVQLASSALYRQTGFMTLAEVEDDLDFLRVLMAAFGAPVVHAMSSHALSSR